MKKILVTGGESRFAKVLKKIKTPYKFIFYGKTKLNINSPKSIQKIIKLSSGPGGWCHYGGV